MSVFKVGSNKSSQNNFPSVRPTLDLDFANSKTLDPRITFTRASGGSYVGADGLIKLAGVNQPRFDHDPYTGESLGFLVEEARTNRVRYSEDFANVAWLKSNATVIANQVVAPNGTLTGSLLYPTATSAYTVIYNGWGPLLGYATLSVYAKSAGKNFLALWRQDFADAAAWFNLSTGEVASVSLGTASIVSVGNGWYRCTYVSIIQNYYPTLIISATDANGSLAVTASGTSGIYIWGGQGSASPTYVSTNSPTSYIPTEASSRTRAADVARMTGTNFSSWYNQSEGTYYAEVLSSSTDAETILSSRRSDGVQTSNGFTLFSSTVYNRAICYLVSLNNDFINYSPVSGKNRLAIAGSSSNTNAYFNSVPGTILTSRTPQAFTVAGIEFGGAAPPNAHIARLTYYPKRLTDAQLQVLTR